MSIQEIHVLEEQNFLLLLIGTAANTSDAYYYLFYTRYFHGIHAKTYIRLEKKLTKYLLSARHCELNYTQDNMVSLTFSTCKLLQDRNLFKKVK